MSVSLSLSLLSLSKNAEFDVFPPDCLQGKSSHAFFKNSVLSLFLFSSAHPPSLYFSFLLCFCYLSIFVFVPRQQQWEGHISLSLFFLGHNHIALTSFCLAFFYLTTMAHREHFLVTSLH